jgi:hypothetical protein
MNDGVVPWKYFWNIDAAGRSTSHGGENHRFLAIAGRSCWNQLYHVSISNHIFANLERLFSQRQELVDCVPGEAT